MAEAEKTGTNYVVLRELTDTSVLAGTPAEGLRVFLTDEKVYEAQGSDPAQRAAALDAKAPGVYAAVPVSSWKPIEYEVEETVVVRRKAAG